MEQRVTRIIAILQERGLWKRGLNAEIARQTGYTASYVGKVFNGTSDPADKFIVSLCHAYDITVHDLQHHRTRIEEVDELIETLNLPQANRIKAIAEITGYSSASVSRFLSGAQPIPGEFFLRLQQVAKKPTTLKQEIAAYLRENLSIEIRETGDMCYEYLRVALLLEGEEISFDLHQLPKD